MKHVKQISVFIILASILGCSRYTIPPDAPVPEASLKKKWVNNSWQRHEVNSYSWRDGHRVTKGKKAVWVEGHRTSPLNGARYIPGHWR